MTSFSLRLEDSTGSNVCISVDTIIFTLYIYTHTIYFTKGYIPSIAFGIVGQT